MESGLIVPAITVSVRPASAIPVSEQRDLIALCSRTFADDFSRLFTRRPNARHAVATRDSRPVAHGCWEPWLIRIGPDVHPAAWISAMAVEPRLQGKGLGRAILDALTDDYGEDRIGVLSAAAPEFYGRTGWLIWSGPVSREGQDPAEPIMIRPRPSGGSVNLTLPLHVFSRAELRDS